MTQLNALKASAQTVQEALTRSGFAYNVVELPATTRSALEAAAAIGCTVAEIAKSIVFRGAASDRPVLVIASGANRVREEAIAALLGEPIARASPEFVRDKTGFVIGGVPPCGHAQPIPTFIDRDLFDLSEVWAAAGHPHAVFRLFPEDLEKLTGGTIAAVA